METTTAKFTDLPPEIVEKIFIYSCHPDIEKYQECIKTISLVSRKWFEMSNTPTIDRKYFRLCLKKDDIKNNCEEIFRNSIRNYYNLSIKLVNFADDEVKEKFLKLLELDNLSKIETLSIYKCAIDYDFICKIIEKVEKLKELKFEECRFPKEFSNTEENCKKITKIISQLISFEYLSNIDQCNLKFLEEFINHTKNLQYYKIEENYQYGEQEYYTSNLSTILYKLIQNNSNSLKNINFFITCDSHRKFLTRYDLKSLNLELNCLSLTNIPISWNLSQILMVSPYLSELELISSNSQEEFFDFTVITEQLKYLKVLSMSWIYLKNFNIFTLNQLKKLKKITLKGCKYDFMTTNPIQSIENLKQLSITDSNKFFNDTIFNIFTENIPNIDTLIIKREKISADQIQMVIKNLTKLKVLCIVECRVSNYALFGVNEETEIQTGLSIENLNNLQQLKISAKILNELNIVKYFKFPNLKMLELIDEDIIETTVIEIIRNCPLLYILIVSIKFDWHKCTEELQKIGKTIDYDNKNSRLEHHRYIIRNC